MHDTIKQMAQMFGVTEHTPQFYTGKARCRARGTAATAGCSTRNPSTGCRASSARRAAARPLRTFRRIAACACWRSPRRISGARYAIILKQREDAYRRLEEAKATVKYMEDKAAHYEAILAGLSPDDTNPRNWTVESRPRH